VQQAMKYAAPYARLLQVMQNQVQVAYPRGQGLIVGVGHPSVAKFRDVDIGSLKAVSIIEAEQ